MSEAWVRVLGTIVGTTVFFSTMHSALAGGFAIREQSVSSQGMSFAGSAAGNDLSSIFWNPAAVTQRDGVNSDSNASLILGDSELTAEDGSLLGTGTDRNSDNIAQPAVVPASYFNMQSSDYDKNLYFGFAITSPFGLVTKPENLNWDGAALGQKSKIFNVNVNPVVGYKIAPGVSIGAGAQISYIDATLRFAQGSSSGPTGSLEGHDVAYGWNVGALFEPLPGTRIGVGYRSKLDHDIEGFVSGLFTPQSLPIPTLPASLSLTLPASVTVSIRQDITPRLRVNGTFEWHEWSELDQVPISSAAFGGFVPVIDAEWEDSWFVSAGVEYDYSDKITVRAGVGYEESPVQTPQQRLTVVPDIDRVWVSAGGSYKMGHAMSIEFAYTHIFTDESEFDRSAFTNPALNLQGTVDTEVDIISVGVKMKLGQVASTADSSPLK